MQKSEKQLTEPVESTSIGFWFLVSSVGLPIAPYVAYQVIRAFSEKKLQSPLYGKVVLITGASSGLGEALAHKFYSQGCKVVIAARRINELSRVKQEMLDSKVGISTFEPLVVKLDLSDVEQCNDCLKQVYDTFGQIDVLINNGGISYRGTVENTKIDVDLRLMMVNYIGPVALTKAVLPSMIERKSGHIVFVSSLQGRMAIPDRSAYAASKHSLQAFADSLRAEVSQHNVNVAVISPGYIKTELSVNALTASGEKYGVMDTTTASGYSPEYVAEKVLQMVMKNQKELVLCPFTHKIALFLRYLWPSLYFWIMSKRAKKTSLS